MVIQRIIKSDVSRLALLFFSYMLVSFLIYLAYFSIVAFFHLNLNHSLKVIEDWIYYYAWESIIVTKIISLTIFLPFINKRKSLEVLWQEDKKPPPHLYIGLIFLYIIIFYLVNPEPNISLDFNWGHILISWFGMFIYLISDIVFIGLIIKNKFSISLKLMLIFLFSTIFLIFNKFTYFHIESNYILSSIFFLMGISILIILKSSFISPSIYILGFVSPICSLLGLDFIWGNNFSPFLSSVPLENLDIFCTALIFCLYLAYSYRHDI